MSFRKLYEAVQKQTCPISTKWLKAKAIELSEITLIREQWSGNIDPKHLRGFYVEGPMGPPMTLLEKQSLIVLSREMCLGHDGAYWRRYIYTKELMHVFDRPEEKAGTPETFDAQIQKWGDPASPRPPQFTAEIKAFWRGLAALCPEAKRIEIIAQLGKDGQSLAVMAAYLRLPVTYMSGLLRPDYLKNLGACMD